MLALKEYLRRTESLRGEHKQLSIRGRLFEGRLA